MRYAESADCSQDQGRIPRMQGARGPPERDPTRNRSPKQAETAVYDTDSDDATSDDGHDATSPLQFEAEAASEASTPSPPTAATLQGLVKHWLHFAETFETQARVFLQSVPSMQHRLPPSVLNLRRETDECIAALAAFQSNRPCRARASLNQTEKALDEFAEQLFVASEQLAAAASLAARGCTAFAGDFSCDPVQAVLCTQRSGIPLPLLREATRTHKLLSKYAQYGSSTICMMRMQLPERLLASWSFVRADAVDCSRCGEMH